MIRFRSAAAIALAGAATSLHASTIQINVDPANGSTSNTGCTAVFTFSFSDSGEALLTLLLENTTPVEIGSRLTAVGLEVPPLPNMQIAFAPGGASAYFDRLDFNVSITPSYLNAPGGYDVMLTSDDNFEGGNSNGAPAAGESQTVVLSLGNINLSPQEVNAAFADYYASTPGYLAIARFQAVGPNGGFSDKVIGTPTPEPITLALLLLGLMLPTGRYGLHPGCWPSAWTRERLVNH